MKKREIRIAGGGLAGLALGIGLRQKEVPVTIWEAGRYPRHRVCGEFINGRGLGALRNLGLLDSLERAGAVQARTAVFSTAHASSPVRQLPEPALCLSRFEMDALLARAFEALGGRLRVGERWRGAFGEGVVRATGRRPAATSEGWQWFGLKAHVREFELAADLEMHAFENGYVGLCRIEQGAVNVCGLFRRRADANAQRITRETLFGPPGSKLRKRLDRAKTDQASVCAVAALPIRQGMAAGDDPSVGDSLAMIPPVTGNGMSMAFESAELALGPLAGYGRGELNWDEARRNIMRAQNQRFARRLTWARWLNSLMFSPALRGCAGSFFLGSELLWKTFYRATR
jgi:2-polyprenyl-6-methoxyphenol hydroxylase-like FAD-dependent oxidoreductase